MNEKFDYQARLGSLFDALEGIDLPIEYFDFSVCIYNSLKRSGIHNLQQFLAMSYDDLISILWGNEKRRYKLCEYIFDKLNDFNINGIPKWGEATAEDEGELKITEVWINGVLIEQSEN